MKTRQKHRPDFHKIPKPLRLATLAAAGITLGIAPATATTNLDFGDAPSSYGTLLVNDGPRHTILANGPKLGTSIDGENDGQPNANANGDNLNSSPDDEDSIPALPNISPTSAGVSMTVKTSNGSGSPATLACWIDFNKNGIFDNLNGEKATVPVPSGSNNTSRSLIFSGFDQPLTTGNTYIRCRIATDAEWLLTPAHFPTPTGSVGNGEVEDYLMPIVSLINGGLPDSDWGDAPNPSACLDFRCVPSTSQDDYQTAADDIGPNHLIVYGTSTLHLGTVAPDVDGSNLQDPSAIDDDISTVTDDEDGIAPEDIPAISTASGPLVTTSLKVKVTNNSGGKAVLGCWIDFNRDGDFLDAGEKAAAVIGSIPNGSQFNTLTFGGYAAPVAGQTYIRCRITSDWYVPGDDVLSKANAVSVGFPASNGEVEDFTTRTYGPCKLAQPLSSTIALGLTPPTGMFTGLRFTLDALATGSHISNIASLNCHKTDNFAVNDIAFIPLADSGPATDPDGSYSWTFPTALETPLQVTAWMATSAGATLACTATDSSGSVCATDPILEQTVRIKNQPVTIAILDGGKPLSPNFRYVKIENGPLGVAQLELIVNGAKFKLTGLNNNGTYFLNLGTALRSDVDNKVTMTVKGKSDSTAIVFISDEPLQ